MKRWLLLSFFIVIAIALIVNSTVLFGASNVVSSNGQLKVSGGKLCNASGTPIQLKGMSSMGLQWYPFTTSTVTNLVNDWKITVVRAAMYTAEGGYLTDPTTMKSRVKTIVDAAISNGIYVLIDWHILTDNNPNTSKDQAKAFFDEMSRTYGSYPNVLYEICNEPNGVDWATIKSYADYVIPTIRANDPDNIIICGTDTWSQGVLNAANNPLSYTNVMYTLHFYAGTHTQSLRDSASAALAKGIAIFVTEWGTSDASGSGGVYLTEAQNWINWMDTNKISWCNWSLCPKTESSAALIPGTSMDGPWADSVLSESGKWVKSKLTGGVTVTPTPVRVTPTPVRITPTPVRTATPRPTATSAVRTATPVRVATPTPNTSGGIKVQMYNANVAATSNTLNPQFRIVNTGTTAIALSTVKFRYYYTIDGEKAQNCFVDWASAGSANLICTFVKMATPKTNADYYVEFGFSSAAGNLAAGANSDIQTRIAKTDWTNYTQTNDYSFNASGNTFADWTKATGYISGALKWGTEP